MPDTLKNPNLEAILKLMKLTIDEEIIWNEEDPEKVDLGITEVYVGGIPYVTTYMGKLFRLSKYKKEVLKENDIPLWKYTTTLQVIDPLGRPIWTFPYNPSIEDLYSTIGFKKAGGQEIYDLLLSEN